MKSKIVLNLTKRQLICFSIAAATGIPFYLLTKDYLGVSGSAVIMIFIMLPAFFFAMYERDGQRLEKIIKNIVMTRYIKKRACPYKTQNFYAMLDKSITHKKEVIRYAKTQQTGKKATKKPAITKNASKRK